MKELLIFETLYVLHHNMEPLTVLGVGTGNLFNLKKFRLAKKRFRKITATPPRPPQPGFLSTFSEADLGLLQLPRWSSL